MTISEDRLRFLFWILISLDIFFVFLHLAFGERFDLFHLDRERTFVAYYSGTQLIVIAGLSLMMVLLSLTKFLRWGWMAVALLFLALGFDEVSELHENITYYVLAYGAGIINEISFFRSPTYNWLVILSPFILAAFIFLFFLSARIRASNPQASRWFFFSLILFLIAVILELAGGFLPPFPGPLKLFVLEEFTEMLAATGMVCSLFLFVSHEFHRQYERR